MVFSSVGAFERLEQQGYSVRNLEQRRLLVHLIVAARILMASKWKSEKIPSKEEWLQKVQYMCLVDKISLWLKIREGGDEAADLFKGTVGVIY